MQVVYGNLFFQPGTVEWRTRKTTPTNAQDDPYEEQVEIDCSGTVLGTDQKNITDLCTVIEATLRRPYQDFVVLRDDGGVAVALRNAASTSGVKVRAGPDYPDGRGAEYTTYRHFRFVATATYPLPNTDFVVLEYQESVRFSGGGPRRAFWEPPVGLPVRWTPNQNTPAYAVQQGRAVGLYREPVPPPPIWGYGSLMEDPEIEPGNGKRVGRVIREIPISWVYRMGSAVRLGGRPRPWT